MCGTLRPDFMRQAFAAEAHRKPCIQAWGPRRLPRTPPDRGTCRSIAPLLRASKQGRLAVAIRGLSPGSFAMSSWPRSNSLHPGPAGPGCKIDRCLTEHKPICHTCLGSPRHLKSSDQSRRPNASFLMACLSPVAGERDVGDPVDKRWQPKWQARSTSSPIPEAVTL